MISVGLPYFLFALGIEIEYEVVTVKSHKWMHMSLCTAADQLTPFPISPTMFQRKQEDWMEIHFLLVII